MTKDSPSSAVPHLSELQTALSELKTSIADLRARSAPDRGSDDSDDLHLKAKLFIEAGNMIPGFVPELERRATFIERETAEGSQFDIARQAFLASIKSACPRRNDLRLQDWLSGVRSPKFAQVGLTGELSRCIELLGWIPHQGIRVVKPQIPGAVENQKAWRIATQKIEEAARRISADGCRYLWLASQHFADDGAMIEFNPERHWLDDIEAAARSMLMYAEKVMAVNSPADAGESRTSTTNYDNALAALLKVFTNGVSDDRITQAATVLADASLSVDQKLTKIDALLPFPHTASAEKLGIMLGGVTKQSVAQSPWWIQNRKGEKQSEIGRRQTQHRERAKGWEDDREDVDEE